MSIGLRGRFPLTPSGEISLIHLVRDSEYLLQQSVTRYILEVIDLALSLKSADNALKIETFERCSGLINLGGRFRDPVRIVVVTLTRSAGVWQLAEVS